MKLLIIRNDLVGADYIEPYAGGAAVALSLLYEGYVTHIHINDLDEAIHAFWYAVLNHTDELCRRIMETEPTMDEWHRQKATLEAPEPDLLDLAYSAFFLNRTNRSGIIRGGVIGGQGQSGRWKLDARYNKPALIKRIENVARSGSHITLTQLDAAEYIGEVLPSLPDNGLVYLDPPYFVKGQGLYRNSYDIEAHAEIADLVPGIKQDWVVSYDAAPEILGLYAAYEPLRYDLSYSAQDRYRGREVMFFKPRMERPEVPSPANIKTAVVKRALRDIPSFPLTS